MIKYMLSPDIDIQPVDDSLVVLALEHNAYYSLNHSARWFFEHITRCTEAEIVREGLAYFDGVSESTLLEDLRAFADEMLAAGILKMKDSGDRA